MMAEISYKISQLCLGIGSGARILNKPYSTPSGGRVPHMEKQKKPTSIQFSDLTAHCYAMGWFWTKILKYSFEKWKNWSRYVCVRYFSLQTVRERLPNPILNGAGKKTTKERTKQMCSPPITCILRIRNNIFQEGKKTNDFMIIIETC